MVLRPLVDEHERVAFLAASSQDAELHLCESLDLLLTYYYSSINK